MFPRLNPHSLFQGAQIEHKTTPAPIEVTYKDFIPTTFIFQL